MKIEIEMKMKINVDMDMNMNENINYLIFEIVVSFWYLKQFFNQGHLSLTASK